MAAVLGAVSNITLKSIERDYLNSVLDGSVAQLEQTINMELRRKFVMLNIFEKAYTDVQYHDISSDMPMVTLPGFISLGREFEELGNFRTLTWQPMVSASQRSTYEAWARKNIMTLGSNLTSTIKTINATAYKYGIFTRLDDIGGRERTKLPIPGISPQRQYLMFPMWNKYPLDSTASTVFTDPHSSIVGGRQDAIERTLNSSFGLADIVQLSYDSYYRPASNLYHTVYSNPDGQKKRKLLGIVTAVFNWDTMMKNALPSYLRGLDCVLTTATSVSTISVYKGAVVVKGRGDLHDPAMSEFGRRITIDTSQWPNVASTNFDITVFPSAALYRSYLTGSPDMVSIALVVLIVGITLVFTGYDFFIRRREKTLISTAEDALIEKMKLEAHTATLQGEGRAGARPRPQRHVKSRGRVA